MRRVSLLERGKVPWGNLGIVDCSLLDARSSKPKRYLCSNAARIINKWFNEFLNPVDCVFGQTTALVNTQLSVVNAPSKDGQRPGTLMGKQYLAPSEICFGGVALYDH